jgi:serine/threonine protein kinase
MLLSNMYVNNPPRGRRMANSCLQIDLEGSDDDIREIQQEISLLSTCASSYVTQYKASFVKGVKLWIVMEYLGGGSCLDLVPPSINCSRLKHANFRSSNQGHSLNHKLQSFAASSSSPSTIFIRRARSIATSKRPTYYYQKKAKSRSPTLVLPHSLRTSNPSA